MRGSKGLIETDTQFIIWLMPKIRRQCFRKVSRLEILFFKFHLVEVDALSDRFRKRNFIRFSWLSPGERHVFVYAPEFVLGHPIKSGLNNERMICIEK